MRICTNASMGIFFYKLTKIEHADKYVTVQAKRALSHCYQNVQNLSKQPNHLKFSVFVLFNQNACIL